VCPSSLLLAYSPGMSQSCSRCHAQAAVQGWGSIPVAGAASCRLEGMQASCPRPAWPAVSALSAAFFCPSCKQHDGPAGLQPRPWSSPYATLYRPQSERLASLAYRRPMLPPTPHLSIFNLLLALSVDCSLVIRHDACCGPCSNFPALNIAIGFRAFAAPGLPSRRLLWSTAISLWSVTIP